MGKDQKIVSDVLLQIPFMRFGLITVSLPAFSLAYCFLSAYLMDREGINDTDCNVSRVLWTCVFQAVTCCLCILVYPQ